MKSFKATYEGENMGDTNPFKCKCKRKYRTWTTCFLYSKIVLRTLYLSSHYKTYTLVSLVIISFYQGNLLDY